MRRLTCISLVSALAFTGCTDSDGEDYPIEPTTTPTPGQTGGSVSRISGRVCVIDDLRAPATCGTRSGGGMTVISGSTAATTAADGTFEMDVPATANPSVTVSGNGIVPTTRPIGTASGGGIDLIPAVDADVYARMLTSNGLELDDGTGSILTSVNMDGTSASGINVASAPTAPFGVFFDSETPLVWGLDGTGMRGVAWIPGLTAGTVDLSYDRITGGLETQVGGVQVRNGGVTILDTALTGSPSL